MVSVEIQVQGHDAVCSSWVNLPTDLLTTISDCLDLTSSIRLSAVCTSWAAALRGCLPTAPPYHPDKPICAHILLLSRSLGRKLCHTVTLCCTPDCTSRFLAVGHIQHEGLVFAKAGDKRWTTVNASENRSYKDVVVYQEELYALTSRSLCCWDLSGFSFKGERLISEESNRKFFWLRQLVEWRGELVMLGIHKDQTCEVKLYKLKLRLRDDAAAHAHSRSHLLSPAGSIGDDAMFIGTNYSYSHETQTQTQTQTQTSWGLDNVTNV